MSVTKLFQATRGRTLLVLAGLLLLAGLVAASPVWAAEIRGGDQVVIGRDEVIDDDLYIGAGTVTIDGTVKGDLFAFAQQITINGTVEGDLLAAGQAVIINGTLGDDVRIAGQALVLGENTRVTDDLLATGYSLENKAGSTVGGDLLFGGYQALLAGSVAEDVKVGLAALALQGAVGGNVDVALGDDGGPQPTFFMPPSPVPVPVVPLGLTVSDSARIEGTLTYESRTIGDISSAAQVLGEVIRREPAFEVEVVAPTPGPAAVALDHLRRLVTLLLVGLLMLWIAPDWTRRLADTVQARPLGSFGWGILAFVAFVVAAIAILVVTILLAAIFGSLTLDSLVGLVVGLGLLTDAALIVGFGIFISYVAQIALSFLGGRWLLERIQPTWAARPILPLAVGLVLFVILTAIPWLGGLVTLIVVLLGLGALWIWGRATLAPAPTQASPVS